MQIKVLEAKFLDEGEVFMKDDIRTVSDSRGEYFCRAGWAEDVAGIVPTGTPDRSEVILKVDNVTSTQVVEDV